MLRDEVVHSVQSGDDETSQPRGVLARMIGTPTRGERNTPSGSTDLRRCSRCWPAWIGDGDHECTDGRAGAGESAELGCSAGNIHADGRFDDACLQKAMGVGVATGITVQ